MFSQTVEYALRAVVHLADQAPSPRTTWREPDSNFQFRTARKAACSECIAITKSFLQGVGIL